MAELGAGSGTGYPGALDTNSTVEVDSPASGKTKARAAVPNDLANAIVAIETELGIDPAGTKTDVKTFLQVEHQTNGKHFHLVTKSADYTTVAGDNWGAFRVDTSGGDKTITLLAAATAGDGAVYAFTNTGSNTLTIDANSSETIAGSTTTTLTQNNSNVLVCDGSNWHLLAGSSSIELVNDLTPQLGGDLDVNGKDIVSASNGEIAITPDGSGDIILDGQKWPQADGTANYVLKTNGSGQLSWVAQNTAGVVAQIVSTRTGEYSSASPSPIVPDDSIPQFAEVQHRSNLDRTITPTSASNRLLILASVLVNSTGGGSLIYFTLHQDSGPAIAVQDESIDGHYSHISLQHDMASPGTSEITFQLGVTGEDGTIYVNGDGGRTFGGSAGSCLTVIEYST